MSTKRMLIAPEASKKMQRAMVLGEIEADPNIDSPAHQRALQRQAERTRVPKDRAEHITVSDQIAEDTMYFRNYMYPGAQKLYPEKIDADQRIVTKYYPYAKGGPLYVSEPVGNYQIRKAYEKAKVLKKEGLRHVVIEENTTLFEALEQLGEI